MQTNAKEIAEFVKFVLSSGGTFLLGIAAVVSIFRVDKLIDLVTKFKDARATAYALQNSILKIEEQVPKLEKQIADVVALGLGKRLDELKVAIDNAAEGIKALNHRQNENERQALIGPLSTVATTTAPGPEVGHGTVEPASTAWERLIDVWNEATIRLEKRLEEAFESAPHQTVRKYARISRRNYGPIIELAYKDTFIDKASGKALWDINQLFLSWRSRNTAMPDDVAEQAEKLLASFDPKVLPPLKQD